MERINCRRLLVIATHQDDETIIASGAMQQVLASSGDVRVVYTTDGGANCALGSQRGGFVLARNQEALAALACAGVTPTQAQFLGFKSGPEFLMPDTAVGVIKELRQIIGDFHPEIIIVGAFEGGNIEHDITNFLVVRAASCSGFTKGQILEAAEYNRFFLREPVYGRLRKFFPAAFAWPPRFPGRGAQGEILRMTKAELANKRHMLECYISQKHVRLVERFAFPERFRPVPSHDYCAGPFKPLESLRYRMQKIFAGQLAFAYDTPGWSESEYRRLFESLQSAL